MRVGLPIPWAPHGTLVLSLHRTAQEELHSLARSLPWSTVVEPAGTEDPVLTRPASEIMQSGDFNRVPMMVGLNSEEGSLIYPRTSPPACDPRSAGGWRWGSNPPSRGSV